LKTDGLNPLLTCPVSTFDLSVSIFLEKSENGTGYRTEVVRTDTKMREALSPCIYRIPNFIRFSSGIVQHAMHPALHCPRLGHNTQLN
jgi:hypothetical protein